LFHDGNVDQHVTLAPGVDRFPPQKQKSKWFILFLRFTLVRTILPSVCTLLRCCGSACCYISDLRGRGFTSFGSVNDLSVLRQVLRGCVHCPLPWDQQISGIPGSNISNGAFGAQIIHVLHEDNLQKLAEFAQQPFRPMTHKPPATCPRNDIDYSALTSLIAFATGAWRRKPAEKCHKHSWPLRVLFTLGDGVKGCGRSCCHCRFLHRDWSCRVRCTRLSQSVSSAAC
jgi:hypothetical protein